MTLSPQMNPADRAGALVRPALPDIALPRIESNLKSLWRVGVKDTNNCYFNDLSVYFEVET